MADQWRDISSAPRDGPHFLVWCPEIQCTFDVYRRHGSDEFLTWPDGNRSIQKYYCLTPTNWTPLPKPPRPDPSEAHPAAAQPVKGGYDNNDWWIYD